MSLERYCRSRLVVLDASATAHQAARAMAANHIGSVIVQDQGSVAGLVTDRDLAVRVVGDGVSPQEVQLRALLNLEPVTIDLTASEAEAAELMRENRVRRIIILDGQRLAGLVTLDDLVVDKVIELTAASAIIADQLAEPSPAKPEGLTRPIRLRRRGDGRRASERRRQTMRNFLRRLTPELGFSDPEDALEAFEIVAIALARRLTPAEASHFAAQLPSEVRDLVLAAPHGPDREVTIGSIVFDLGRTFDLDDERAARLAKRVGRSLRNFVSDGELEDVRSQLPESMQALVPIDSH
jgi:CBS domain-containing protein/uncharacterized protein (DUF2267 family)